jgi:hypothetical protein
LLFVGRRNAADWLCAWFSDYWPQEKKALEKLRQARRERGEEVTDDEDDA